MNCVYAIDHPSTGVTYIGRTSNFPRRKLNHLSTLNRGEHSNSILQEVYSSDNNIVWSVHEVASKEDAIELERKLITERKDDPGLANYHLAKTSTKVISSFTEERRQDMSARGKLRKHTDETKLKIGLAHKGRTPSDDTLRKAAEVNSKNVTVDGVFYRTASDAAVALNVHVSTVLNRARNPRATWDNWQLVDGGVF